MLVERSSSALTLSLAVTSTMHGAAPSSECARCGAGAGCSAIKYQSLSQVAETSITIPGIKYVVDTGRVKVNPKPETHNSKPKTQDPRPKIHDQNSKSQIPNPKSKSPELKIQNPRAQKKKPKP